MGVAVLAACGAGVLPAEGVVVVLGPAGLGVVGAGLGGGVAVLAGPVPGARVEAEEGRLALVGLKNKKKPTLDRSLPGGGSGSEVSYSTGGVRGDTEFRLLQCVLEAS